MRTFLRSQLWPAFAILALMTAITGFLYPAVVTAVAQVAFPSQANGSLISANEHIVGSDRPGGEAVGSDRPGGEAVGSDRPGGEAVGSVLIGQSFDDPKYLWSRPSAAGQNGYDPTSSGASNLSPTSKALIDRILKEVDTLRAASGGGPVPGDLVTASGSGLDPHISPQAAEYQVARIASARGMTEDAVRAIVARHTEGPTLGFLDEARVNVLLVNLDLDGLLR
jgi:potassium-transporting ATPase KdpC subunit